MENGLPAPAECSLLKKLGLRFLFLFFTLYIFLNPNNIIPFTAGICRTYLQMCGRVISWFMIDILHLATPSIDRTITTTDTTFGYLTLLFIILLAVIGAVIWIAIKKAANDKKLYELLILIVRYFLAIMWIAYGSVKIARLQFPPISPHTLLQTYGNSTPRELAWAYMGYSSGYNYFLGITECAIGIGLFFRRIVTISNLIGIGALANVMAFDYFFDVNVKLLATVLMSMSLFLLSKDIKRLIAFFFDRKLADQTETLKDRKNSTVLLFLKCAFIICLLFSDLYVDFAAVKQRATGTVKPPLYGIYKVERSVIGFDDGRSSQDTLHWSKLMISSPGKVTVIFSNDTQQDLIFKPDTVKHTVEMYPDADTVNKYSFSYGQLSPNELILSGEWRKGPIEVDLRKYDLDKFPLMNRHFRWRVDHSTNSKK